MYAERHGDGFGRIDAVIRDLDGRMLRLDMKDPTVRSALEKANTKEQVLGVFTRHGGECG